MRVCLLRHLALTTHLVVIIRANLHILIVVALAASLLGGCAAGMQKAYWDAGTGVAIDEERKGDYEAAEIEYKKALWRAENMLTPAEVSDSLYNLGSFYRRQQRANEAIPYLIESLRLEETLSGAASDKTGRRVAELALAYLGNGDRGKAAPLVERLKALASLYAGKERETVNRIIEEFNRDPAPYQAAIAKLKPRAEQRDPQAMYELATYYEDGRGVPQDYQKAIALYEGAAEAGFLDAQYYLGVIYNKGRGVGPDEAKAAKWFRTAAERGHAIAQYNYAICLLEGKGGVQNKEEAMTWLRKSADQQYPPALSALRELEQK